MRGVIPCYLLAKLDALIKEKGDERPFIDHFDLVAGTSTGALIALALTIPLEKSGFEKQQGQKRIVHSRTLPRSFFDKLLRRKAKTEKLGLFPLSPSIGEIKNLYRENGRRIFPKVQSRLFGSLFTEKYDVEPLEQFLKDKLLDTPLEESILPVLALSYDIANEGKPFPFSSRDSHGFLFREAARASSAAPSYFKPATLRDRETGEELMLIDGALVANNPVLYAYREARRLYPDCSTFHVLSLATRKPEVHVDMHGSTGVVAWIDPSQGAPLQKILSVSQEQTSSQIIRSISGIDYVRIEGSLSKPCKLDEVSPEALDSLELDAQAMFENAKEEIERFADLLASRTEFDQLKLDPLPPVSLKVQDHALQTATP